MASWLFGNRNQYPQNFSQYVPPASGGQGGDDNNDDHNKNKQDKNKQMDSYRFDSSALERAAQAAKDLENSKFAAQALELSKQQEITKQQEIQARVKEYESQLESNKAHNDRVAAEERRQSERIAAEERRKLMELQAKQDVNKMQLQDKYARQREQDLLAQKKIADDERRLRDEESVTKMEAQRRATSEHDRKLEYEYKRKIQIESIAEQAKVERDNHDIKMEQLKLESTQNRLTTLESLKEKRVTLIEAIKTATSSVGGGLNAFVSDPNKIMYTVGGLVALTAGYYTAKGSLGVLFRIMEARLATPSLVRETSRITPVEVIKHPINTVKKLNRNPKEVMHGIILNEGLEMSLRDVALATKNTKINKGFFRNVLLYGPPGTGKTLYARQLALHSNMNYAILSGGDIGMMGAGGVSAIHKVFDWANTSRKGLVLFIDEAEGFLGKRNKDISENLRLAMNAFLFQTGTPSDKFMLVIASNIPEDLDGAVLDRINEKIEFALPALKERRSLVKLYMDKHILHPASEGKKRIKIADKFLEDNRLLGEVCDKVAKVTEGLSAREISNLAVDWQMTTYASEKGTLTEEMIFNRVDVAVRGNRSKISWYSKEEFKKSAFSQAVIDAVQRETK